MIFKNIHLYSEKNTLIFFRHQIYIFFFFFVLLKNYFMESNSQDELFSNLQKYTSFVKLKVNVVQVTKNESFIDYVIKLCNYFFNTDIYENLFIHVNKKYYCQETIYDYLKNIYSDEVTKSNNDIDNSVTIILSKMREIDKTEYENIIVQSEDFFYPSDFDLGFYNILLPDITILNYVGYEKITSNYKNVTGFSSENYKTIYDRLIIYNDNISQNDNTVTHFDYKILKCEQQTTIKTVIEKQSSIKINFDVENTRKELYDFKNMKISRLKSIIVYLNKNRGFKSKSKGYTKLKRNELVYFFEQNYDEIEKLL